MLYFAYGSNLLDERLKLHVPVARFVGVGELTGWRRVFQLRSRDGSAKCDAIRANDRDEILHGALYEIDPAGRAALDEWEGLGFMYHVEQTVVRTTNGLLEVFFYAGNESHVDRSLRPYDWYLASIIAGATRHGLPTQIITKLADEAVWPDPDPARAERNWALIPPEPG